MIETPLFDDPHQAELAEVLGFTPDDLFSNQNGHLTEEQYARLQYNLYRSQLLEGSPLIAAILAVAVLIVVLIDSTVQSGIVLAIASILIGLLFLYAPLWLKHEEPDLESVLCATVKISGFWLLFRTSMWYDGHEIIFSRNLLQKLQPWQTYHIYFLPVHIIHGNIVSIEPTEDDPELYKKHKRKRGPDKSNRAA